MDFYLTNEQEKFRQEVRAFFARELPEDWNDNGQFEDETFEGEEFGNYMRKKLAQKGWLAMTWPGKYGGSERPHMDEVIFQEELNYCTGSYVGWDPHGLGMFGPTLLIYGTEEQKMEHLPRMARGEVKWCQGFSEPGAGSDMASLQLRAVEEGDHFVINGQKVWTVGAHIADWIFFLARTDTSGPKKHQGITFLYAEMKTPGITTRPLINITNKHQFNETFFDDVKVPNTNIVGERNKGWYVAMSLLSFERSGIVYPARGRRMLEGLVKYVKETRRDGKLLSEDPIIKNQLAELATEVEVARLFSYKIAWMQSKGLVPTYEPAICKAFGTETLQRIATAGTRIMGQYGQLEPGSRYVPVSGAPEREYLANIGVITAAGTSEVQRNVIANQGLGLPKAY